MRDRKIFDINRDKCLKTKRQMFILGLISHCVNWLCGHLFICGASISIVLVVVFQTRGASGDEIECPARLVRKEMVGVELYIYIQTVPEKETRVFS